MDIEHAASKSLLLLFHSIFPLPKPTSLSIRRSAVGIYTTICQTNIIDDHRLALLSFKRNMWNVYKVVVVVVVTHMCLGAIHVKSEVFFEVVLYHLILSRGLVCAHKVNSLT